MADDLKSLVKEPDLPGDALKELPYPNMLKDLSMQALEGRPRFDYRGLSAKQVQARLTEVRATLRRHLGLPARAVVKPCNVAERAAVQFDGFSIRPVAIEREPGWYITAHLYVPDGLIQPAPAVMHVHGHSYQGKSAPFYARRCRGLARRGFVVLFVDYPEADERKGTGHAVWFPTLANMPMQGIMVADNSAGLTYLASLPFVDGKRIGVTGASGGGNQSAFFAAADPRVAAAAPCDAPTLFFYHAAIGGGAWCHCEAVPGLAAAGIEYHDLLAAAAPRPLRVFAGVLDYLFPIVGARLVVRDAAVAYAALGASGGCTLEEHYCGHDVPMSAREGIYRFFAQALKRRGDLAGPGGEGEAPDFSDPRLRALPRRPRDFKTIGDLYRAKLAKATPKAPTPGALNRLLGRRAAEADAREAVRWEEGGYLHVLLQTGDGALVPMVVRKGGGKVTLVLSDGGKAEALAGAGKGAVAVLDWRGQGETSPTGDEWQQRALHYLAIGGRALVGGRVTDVVAGVRWLNRNGLAVGKVAALTPEASMVALLAACVEQSLPRVELHGMLRAFRDAAGMAGQLRYTAYAPGMALATDIPQLLAALGKRAVVKSWLKPGPDAIREGYT